MKKSEIMIHKLNEIVSKKPSGWIEKAKEREANRDWSLKSAKIALLILNEIRARKISQEMSQKMLAEKMDVSAQYVNKILKGQENLSLETICKIEKALGISLIEIRSFEDNLKNDDVFSNALKAHQYIHVYSHNLRFFKVGEDFNKTIIIRKGFKADGDYSKKNEFSNLKDFFYIIQQNIQFIDDSPEADFANFIIDIRKKSTTPKKPESENVFA